MAITSFLIGILHEGFTIPLTIMIGCMMLTDKSQRGTRQKYLFAGLAAGLLWFLLWPVSWYRFNREHTTNSGQYTLSYILYIFHLHIELLAVIILTTALYIKRRLQTFVTNGFTVALIAGTVASICLQLLTTYTPRTGWVSYICAILLILTALKILFPKFAKRYTNTYRLICIPILLITFLKLGITAYWSIRINRNYSQVAELFKQGNRYIFTDMPSEKDLPWLCMYTPNMKIYQEYNYLSLIYFPDDEKHEFNVVPKELRKATLQSGERVASVTDNCDYGIRRIGNWLYMPFKELPENKFYAAVDLGVCTNPKVLISTYPFISEADGKKYMFLHTNRNLLTRKFEHPEAITPNPEYKFDSITN